MARVPGRGAPPRMRRGTVWILITAIAIFLVVMLPAERKKPEQTQVRLSSHHLPPRSAGPGFVDLSLLLLLAGAKGHRSDGKSSWNGRGASGGHGCGRRERGKGGTGGPARGGSSSRGGRRRAASAHGPGGRQQLAVRHGRVLRGASQEGRRPSHQNGAAQRAGARGRMDRQTAGKRSGARTASLPLHAPSARILACMLSASLPPL